MQDPAGATPAQTSEPEVTKQEKVADATAAAVIPAVAAKTEPEVAPAPAEDVATAPEPATPLAHKRDRDERDEGAGGNDTSVGPVETAAPVVAEPPVTAAPQPDAQNTPAGEGDDEPAPAKKRRAGVFA